MSRRPRPRSRRGVSLALAALVAVVVGIAVGFRLGGGGGSTQPTTTSVARATSPSPARPEPRRNPTVSELDRLIRLGRPLYCGGHTGHYVALTFDDGPGPYTPLALRILQRARVHATFFIVGRNIAGWPDLPRQELELAALGDHSWTHPELTRLTAEEMRSELADTKSAIEKASGEPVKLFRPPYGAHNAAIDAQAGALGMLQVLWSIDSGDSQGADYDQIQKTVLREIRPGSIVLLHENRGQAIRAVKYHILPELRRRGLTPVTVPELLERDPPSAAQLRAGGGGC